MSLEQRAQILSSALLHPNRGFNLIEALGRAFLTGKEAEEVVYGIIQLYQRASRDLELINFMIETEVSLRKDPTTLFRSEEFPSRTLRAYTRINGIEFAQTALGRHIKKVNDNDIQLEVDPNRERYDPSHISILETMAQEFLDEILKSIDYMPVAFIKIASNIAGKVKAKFGTDSLQLAMAGFIFLRFFCPCVASPETFKLPEINSIETRRTLLLIGKVLQNLANGTKFKEPYMAELNRFLIKNDKPMKEFLGQVMTYPPQVTGRSGYIKTMTAHIYKRREKFTKQIKERAPDQVDFHFSDVIKPHLLDRLEDVLDAVCPKPVSPALQIPGEKSHKHKAGSLQDIGKTTKRSIKFGDRGSPLVLALINVLTDNKEMAQTITNALIVSNNDSELNSVAKWLVTIFHAEYQMDVLTEAIIDVEVTNNYSQHQYLHSSMSKAIFVEFSMSYCQTWLKQVLARLVEPIVSDNMELEVDNTLLPPEAKATMLDKLRITSDNFITAILQGLATCPSGLWVFANTLARNTTQDVFSFIFINYFCKAIERPARYGITTNSRPGRKAMRTLALVADVLRNISTKAKHWIQDLDLDEELWKRPFYRIQEWSMSRPARLSKTRVPVAWNNEKSALSDLVGWIMSNKSNMFSMLHKSGNKTEHRVEFKIISLLEVLQPSERQATRNRSHSVGESDAPKKKKSNKKKHNSRGDLPMKYVN